MKKLLSWIRRHAVLFHAMVFALIISVVSTVSLAWVANNRNSLSNGMSAEADEGDDTVLSFKYYQHDRVNPVVTKTVSDGSGITIDFNQYDMIFLARNRYTACIIEIELERHEYIAEEGTVQIYIARDTSKGTATQLSDYSSSMMRFTTFIDQDVTYSDDATELYETVDTKYYNTVKGYTVLNNTAPENSKTFTSVTKISDDEYSYQKVNGIEINIDYTASDWTDEGKLHCYLYVTYDEGLIERYRHEKNLSSLSVGGNIITFENDFTNISVTYTRRAV